MMPLNESTMLTGRELPNILGGVLGRRTQETGARMSSNTSRPPATKSPGADDRRFPNTSWSLLARAGSRDDDTAAAEFAERYFSAVRAFVLAIVRNPDECDDLAQQFFLKVVLTGRLLRQADQTKGRFRAFLKQAIRNFLVDEFRRRRSIADHASGKTVSPDGLDGGWDLVATDPTPDPDRELLKAWGQNLIAMALTRVKTLCKAKGQDEHFELFTRRFLSGSDEFTSWREVGEPFGLDEKTTRSRALIAMERFRNTLRDLIATDMGSTSDVNQEIRELIRIV
jgi:RNA polymerase sigma factor (sigma-70 family)